MKQQIKIIAIFGSPKKTGETLRQLQLYERAITRHGDVDFEYIFLKDYTILECKGCGVCFDYGEERCPLKDDVTIILNKIKEADGIILASPVYSLHITATLKKLLDRLSYLMHRSELYTKKGFVVAPKGLLFPAVPKYLTNVLKAWLIDVKGTSSMTILEYLPEHMQKEGIKKIKTQMDSFYKALKRGKLKSPSVMDIITFNMWKYRASIRDKKNVDYHYFKEKGYLDAFYYYDVNINIVKKLVCILLTKITIGYMKNKFGDLTRAI